MTGYDFLQPRTIEEALRLRADRPGACFIAGGTDLQIQIRRRQIPVPGELISLRSIPDLSSIEVDGSFRIGPLVTVRDLIDHPEVREVFPALAAAARTLGSAQVRNLATIGGNLCKASPAADLAPPLLAAAATVEASGAEGSREIPLDAFFVGPGETVLRPEEILTAIILERPPARSRAVLLRRGRGKIDLATVSVAAQAEMEGDRCIAGRIAAGAVAPVPCRLKRVEGLIAGEELTGGLIDRAAEAAQEEVSPISDIRASAGYRRRLVGVYIRRALQGLRRGDSS